MQFLPVLALFGLLVIGCAVGQSTDSSATPAKETGGITWFRTTMLVDVVDFYIQVMGCTLWLDQGTCKVLQHGNLLLGFCQADEADLDALPCFFYRDKSLVDQMYQRLIATAEAAPRDNERYRIYHFYARDPENRRIEVQHFCHDLPPF